MSESAAQKDEQEPVLAVFEITAFTDNSGRNIVRRTNVSTESFVFVGSATVRLSGRSPLGEPINFTYEAQFEINAHTPLQAFNFLDAAAKAARPRMEEEAKLALKERLDAMQRPPGIEIAKPNEVPPAPIAP